MKPTVNKLSMDNTYIKLNENSAKEDEIPVKELKSEGHGKLKEQIYNEARNPITVCLFIILIISLIVLVRVCFTSHHEEKTVSIYKMIHVSSQETYDSYCDDTNIERDFSCLIQGNNWNLPKCLTDSQKPDWEENLDIINRLKLSDDTKFVDANFKLRVLRVGMTKSDDKIVATDTTDLDFRLSKMTVCLGKAFAYVTLVDGVMSNTKRSVFPKMIKSGGGSEKINIFSDSSQEKQQDNENLDSEMSDYQEPNIDWIPCDLSGASIVCEGKTEMTSQKGSDLNIHNNEGAASTDEQMDIMLMESILTRISNKDKEFENKEKGKRFNSEIVGIFFELFKLPVVKKKFTDLSDMLLEEEEDDNHRIELLATFTHNKNTTSTRHNIFKPLSFGLDS